MPPIFRLFTQQFDDAKSAFLSLSKRYRGKKSGELEQKLIFLEIYVDFLSRIHFKEENLKFQLFSPFKKIFKGLKKTKHIKMIMRQVESVKMRDNVVFDSYTKSLESEKNKHYAEVYDLIVSTPLQVWDEFFDSVYAYSKNLKPLMVNTSTTQIINEELEFFNLDNKSKLDTKALKDIYEGIRVIIALENLRIESGFNSIFVKEVHDRMSELQKDLLVWYENQLFLLHLTGFLTDKENISKKYIDLLASLNQNKKSRTAKVEAKCRELFDRILE